MPPFARSKICLTKDVGSIITIIVPQAYLPPGGGFDLRQL